ncbi:CRISP/Allergen/PR-1-like [Ornithodoros turicata]|uniref:CRISP/Allergen/PR-1-like n=1 Tax=Ornithodoros turicata TaxID=34597 RepID=UPI00313A2F61
MLRQRLYLVFVLWSLLHASASLSAHERDRIVDLHNGYRSMVAAGRKKPWPPAADMMEMSYNITLEELADIHIRNCIFQPGCTGCHIALENRPGQNLYAQTGEADWVNAIGSWYHTEPGLTSKGRINGSLELEPNTLVQMVWSQTYSLGCSWQNCAKTLGTNIYLCNYYPYGNVLGQKVFIPGEPCSACPKNTCCSTLCAGTLHKHGSPGLCRML